MNDTTPTTLSPGDVKGQLSEKQRTVLEHRLAEAIAEKMQASTTYRWMTGDRPGLTIRHGENGWEVEDWNNTGQIDQIEATRESVYENATRGYFFYSYYLNEETTVDELIAHVAIDGEC